MGKNVLVTGGAGYIGSHACKALARAGHVPVTYDNLLHGHREAVRWGPFVHGDIADRSTLSRAFSSHEIGAVMHFAALAYVGESMRSPQMYFQNNVVGTLTLLETMRERGVHNIVFSSTCATYGEPEVVPITEEVLQRPVNPYGESKRTVERMLYWYDVAHDFRYAVLRYFNAAGADPDGEAGEHHDPETHLIPLALDVALGRRPHVDVLGTDYPTADGTAVRDYIHVQDLADAHVKALLLLENGASSMALNLGAGQGHSVRQVLSVVEKVTGRPVMQREAPRRPGDPAVLVADPERARKVLRWAPRLSGMETIIQTAWRWHCRGLGANNHLRR
ncbi:MAG: UDP-glucose 4-epimerase GalE [Myxococcota bacterium]